MVWFFGGFGRNAAGAKGFLADLWKFDPSKGMFQWAGGPQALNAAPQFGSQGTPAGGNTPGGRQGAAFSVATSAGTAYLYGGQQVASGAFSDDFWRFTSNNMQWAWLYGSSAPANVSLSQGGVSDTPGGRQSAAMWCDDNNAWLFGGRAPNDGTCRASVSICRSWARSSKYCSPTCGRRTSWSVSGRWPRAPRRRTRRVRTERSALRLLARTPVRGLRPSRGATPRPEWRLFLEDSAWVARPARLVRCVTLFRGRGRVRQCGALTRSSRAGFLADLWMFDAVNSAWAHMGGPTTVNALATYGAQLVAAAANMPSGRQYATAWPTTTGGLRLFGGQGIAGAVPTPSCTSRGTGAREAEATVHASFSERSVNCVTRARACVRGTRS